MSGRGIVYSQEFFNQTAQASVFTSDSFDVQPVDRVTIEVVWSNGSGSPAGDIAIQGSLDGVTWNDLTLGPSTPAISGNSGSHLISLLWLAFKYIRFVWNRSAGQVDLVGRIMAKEF